MNLVATRVAFLGVLFLVGAIAPTSVSGAGVKSEQASVLFVVNGASGTLVPREDAPGTFTLSLAGVDERVTWFSDRPVRAAGAAEPASAISAIGFGDEGDGPPNAVVSARGSGAGQDTLAVTLRDPVYDDTADTMSFNATPLKRPAKVLDPRLDFADDRFDSGLAESFDAVTVFIDDTDTAVQTDGDLAPTDPVPSNPDADDADTTPTTAGAPDTTPDTTPTTPASTVPSDSTPDTRPPGEGSVLDIDVRVTGASKELLKLSVTPIQDDYNNCIKDPGSTEVNLGISDDPGWYNERTVTVLTNDFSSCALESSRQHWLAKFTQGTVSGIAEIRLAQNGPSSPYLTNCAAMGATTLPKLDCTWGWHAYQQRIDIRVVSR